MKKFSRLFQEAERISPPEALWKRIEARTGLTPGGNPETAGAGFWSGSGLRAAAAVVLAAGVLGGGMLWQQRSGSGRVTVFSQEASRGSAPHGGAVVAQTAAAGVTQAADAGESEIVDPELLGWLADLGELDDEVVEAEEML